MSQLEEQSDVCEKQILKAIDMMSDAVNRASAEDIRYTTAAMLTACAGMLMVINARLRNH